MNILLLGGGGREHALAWKLSQSEHCQQLFIAPGNAGTHLHGINAAGLNPLDFKAVGEFVLSNEVNMVVVGPEEPLVRGITDYFTQHEKLRNVLLIGPSREGAQLEGSKAYAKAFMADYGIPTAAYKEFTKEQLIEGQAYIDQQRPPIVLKADGLAAGKGVLILSDKETAKKELAQMLNGKFGEASTKVVIEQFLDGIEFSVFVLTDGKDYLVLPEAKDYKRIGEGDTGLNTGGMGAVSPVPFVTEELMAKVDRQIIQPTIRGLQERNISYRGFIFLGLIMVDSEPFVIEYNCRLGDPETEVVLPRIKNDLVELLAATVKQELAMQKLEIDERAATTVMLVSGGYPGSYEKGKVISGSENLSDSMVFYAGTQKSQEHLLTSGGRVLAITSYGKDFRQALQLSKANAEKVKFDGKYYRKDIGFDL